jgi:hypothetical protein
MSFNKVVFELTQALTMCILISSDNQAIYWGNFSNFPS